MIISILGNLRTGKTFLMTVLAYLAVKFAYYELSDKDMIRLINATEEYDYNLNTKPSKDTIIVRANYKIKIPNFELFGVDKLLELITLIEDGKEYDLQDCVLCLDEIWSILESRISHAKVNRLMSYFIMQSGKADVQLIYTAQLAKMADLRLRELANISVRCRKDSNNRKFIYLWSTDTGFTKKFTISFAVAEKLYYLYDTKYKIPLASIQIKKKLKEREEQAKLDKALKV